jgi:preprotein translocase subunit SecA
MGLFDSLFRSGASPPPDAGQERIWMSARAKFAGIAAELDEKTRSDAAAILLVAHFPDLLERLEPLAEKQSGRVPVKAVLAGDLTEELASRLGDAGRLELIVAERHPLRSIDDELEQFARELPCESRVSHHLALDDAVIRAFAGDWVRNMLQKMGMSDDESIESEMVSRQIRQAQRKIESQTFTDTAAESAEAWLRKNCPVHAAALG